MKTKKSRETYAALLLKQREKDRVQVSEYSAKTKGRIVKRSKCAQRRKMLMDLYGAQCYWCKCELTNDTCTIEHLVRACDGGTNAITNLRPACGPCNWNRGTETDPEIVVRKSSSWKDRYGWGVALAASMVPPAGVPVEEDYRAYVDMFLGRPDRIDGYE
jgi:hypothetical protein